MGNRNKKRVARKKRELLSDQQLGDLIEEFTLSSHKIMKKRINRSK